MAKFEPRMAARVDADPEMQAIPRHLQTAPGVGPIVAATLIAEMPELGQVDRSNQLGDWSAASGRCCSVGMRAAASIARSS